MESKGALLFVVSGLGLGNSTRCDSLVDYLVEAGHEVDVMTSQNGLFYFKGRGQVRRVFEMEALHYGKNNRGQLSVGQTLAQCPRFWRTFLRNKRALSRLLSAGAYKALVIDSDYTLGVMKGRGSLPVIALNNSHVIVEEAGKLAPLSGGVRAQLWIERLDRLFHSWVPDLVLCPSYLPRLHSSEKVVSLPPPIRRGLVFREPRASVQNLLVMLSGSQFGSPTGFLEALSLPEGVRVTVLGREGASTERVRYLGKVARSEPYVNECDAMVINAGFSATSEAAVLQKPAVVIPIENHAEQLVNARLFEKNGWGLCASAAEAAAQANRLLRDFPRFQEAYKRRAPSRRGAQEAVKVMENFLKTRA